MTEIKNEQQIPSFKRKVENTTYTVKVHFNKNNDKTFKDSEQKLIINECLEKIKNNPPLDKAYQIFDASADMSAIGLFLSMKRACPRYFTALKDNVATARNV